MSHFPRGKVSLPLVLDLAHWGRHDGVSGETGCGVDRNGMQNMSHDVSADHQGREGFCSRFRQEHTLGRAKAPALELGVGSVRERSGVGVMRGWAWLGLFCLGALCSSGRAAEESLDRPPPPPTAVSLLIEPAASAKPLNPKGTVFLDSVNKKVVLRGQLCMREGLLEMLVCKTQTKEHESVISIDADAYVIHAALMALGAKPGTPVRFQPEYAPPTGQKIEIYVGWTDEFGRPQRYPAQKLIRKVTQRYYTGILDPLPKDLQFDNRGDLRYDTSTKELIWFGRMNAVQKKALLARSGAKAYQQLIEKFFADSQPQDLDANFIFAGSSFYKQKDGTQYYMAEAGDIICVANYGDAMIDISVRSSADNGGLMFEPYTERLPNRRTAMTIELIPVGWGAAGTGPAKD